jgi:hypothetical protein
MPQIMSLEGPQLRAVDTIRGQLYGTLPRPYWRAHAELQGMFDPVVNPIKAHPWAALGGLLLGMWLAGSSKGRSLVAKYTGGRR